MHVKRKDINLLIQACNFSVGWGPTAFCTWYHCCDVFWHLSQYHQHLECTVVLWCHAPMCCITNPAQHQSITPYSHNTFKTGILQNMSLHACCSNKGTKCSWQLNFTQQKFTICHMEHSVNIIFLHTLVILK
jgi:hypothetical protein